MQLSGPCSSLQSSVFSPLFAAAHQKMYQHSTCGKGTEVTHLQGDLKGWWRVAELGESLREGSVLFVKSQGAFFFFLSPHCFFLHSLCDQWRK